MWKYCGKHEIGTHLIPYLGNWGNRRATYELAYGIMQFHFFVLQTNGSYINRNIPKPLSFFSVCYDLNVFFLTRVSDLDPISIRCRADFWNVFSKYVSCQVLTTAMAFSFAFPRKLSSSMWAGDPSSQSPAVGHERELFVSVARTSGGGTRGTSHGTRRAIAFWPYGHCKKQGGALVWNH